ncbi:glycerol-3-phosphate 1-O-acyltransferase [Deltaproteobacteria bacterium]|nr:glycerol-3-phosphate 1-O-acyltransferase [Deltaproteobacteria bacterium]
MEGFGRLVGTVILTIVVWELVRWAAWRTLRERWQTSIGEWMRRYDVKLEHFRFIDRMWVRQTLLQDPELDKAAAERAKELGTSVGEVRVKMEGWLDEIVPVFNLFSYYKLGGAVATAAVRFCYELVFDHEGLAAARKAIPEGAVTVYVANHRSNADYIVLSVGAMRQVALSYAVGEWARVWPLDTLFRSFGSYMIRRGEKDPLYHRVLSRYLQLVAARGLTTAFFLEGALSRDGSFRVPKIGLLDYMVGILREQPGKEICFVPVGINFDRVLEDRNLTVEVADGPPPGFSAKLVSLGRILRAGPRLALGVFGPSWLAAHRRYGYASVQFGKVVPVRELAPDIDAVAQLPRKERFARMALLADQLMDRIAQVVPATPVVLVCRALDAGATDPGAVRRHVREQIAAFRESGRPIAEGLAFASVSRARRDSTLTHTELDDHIVDSEEADRVVDLAFALLRRRSLMELRDGKVHIEPRDLALIRYYARSLDAPSRRAADVKG